MNLISKLSSEVNKRKIKLVIVGDVMVDHWVHGYVKDCQDGCSKFVRESFVSVPGGAGNARSCLNNWNNIWIRSFGQRYEDCPNKWRFVDKDGVIIFRYDDESVSLDEVVYRSVRKNMLDAVNDASGVLISDYDKGFLTPEIIHNVIETCKWCKIPCVADCKRNMTIYDGCVRKGNAAYWGSYPLPINGVATYGQDGPSVYGCNTPIGSRLLPVKCVNHVGAGDCFAAHLTLALACGFSLVEAATVAHSAGRVYVQHPHNRPPHPREIEEDLNSC